MSLGSVLNKTQIGYEISFFGHLCLVGDGQSETKQLEIDQQDDRQQKTDNVVVVVTKPTTTTVCFD